MICKPQLPFSAGTLSKIYRENEERNSFTQKVSLFRNNTIKCLGFVVNVKDPINFDIDFKLTLEDQKKLLKAKTKNYIYDEYINYEFTSKKCFGETYRCRIYDVRVNRKELVGIKKLKVFNKIRNQLDDCDGWVVCEIYGIDAYGRLLVDLYFPLDNRHLDKGWHFLNLKDLLAEEKRQIFQIKYK